MSGLSDAHHFRKLVAGVCMVLAPLFILVASVVHPDAKADEAAQLSVIADHLDAWYAAHLLALVGIALAVPAVLGLMHMLREREVALGHVGGGLGMIGLLAFTGIITIEGFVGWQMGAAGDRGEMVALLERVYEAEGIVIPFFMVSFAFALGMICLAVGLYRARAVQSWMALFVTVGAVATAVAGPMAAGWLMILGAAFLFVGVGSIGRLVLMETDEDWEHTPEYRGFQPLPGVR